MKDARDDFLYINAVISQIIQIKKPIKKSEAGKLTEEHYKKITTVKSEILGSKIVRAVGPRYYQTVVDVRITK